MSLVSVGTVAFDAIETPFGKVDKIVGGAALYISLAASYFYDKCKIVSIIGDDYDQKTLDLMSNKGIDLKGLEIKKGEKSFFWSGKYHYDLNSRDTLITDLNVLAEFDPVLPEEYKDPDLVMLGNLSPSVQLSVIEQINPRPKLVALDTMNFWMDSAPKELDMAIAKIDLLTINDEEARQYTGEHSLVKAAKKILKKGPKYLVIKKGEHGALLFHDNDLFFAPALPLEDVIDPTGAGDTFAGGMMGYLAGTKNLSFENLKRAVIAGSAMASFAVEAFGPEKLYDLDQAMIDSRIAEFRSLISF
ncbi:MAG: sugar kinase [Flavobacteriales bacterium]|nr:sugar kinase [Flavobacteriales bacterium]